MCTAINFKTKKTYFGRTFDYDFSYNEKVIITPRKYEFTFKNKRTINDHYALIGIGIIIDNYPLYYDCINEKGLGIAGLNFVNNAVYFNNNPTKENVASYELIPYILCQCQNIKEVKKLLKRINITNESFSDKLKYSHLHWMISDISGHSIVVESTIDGLKVYDNKVGVLTNNPPFNYQLFNLNNYMKISANDPLNTFSSKISLNKYSRGLGGVGLPGDLSSMSRFVRATFTKFNSICNDDESSSVTQFFHILNSVFQQNGCCKVSDEYEKTIYTSCCNLNEGIYYYTTYNNSQINAINMFHTNYLASELIVYSLNDKQNINFIN